MLCIDMPVQSLLPIESCPTKLTGMDLSLEVANVGRAVFPLALMSHQIDLISELLSTPCTGNIPCHFTMVLFHVLSECCISAEISITFVTMWYFYCAAHLSQQMVLKFELWHR